MAPSNISICSIALTLSILLSALIGTSSLPSDPNTIYLYSEYINIRNKMGNGKVLMLACYTNKGRFLSKGVEALEYGETIFWNTPVSSKKHVINTCNMSSLDPHVHGTFDVFDSAKDLRGERCDQDQCLWDVRVDGLWVYIGHSSRYRKEYSWTATDP